MNSEKHCYLTKLAFIVILIFVVQMFVNMFVFGLNPVFLETNPSDNEKQVEKPANETPTADFNDIEPCLNNLNQSLSNQSAVKQCKQKYNLEVR